MMKVSLIIPVYNVSNYIEDCLASVISQTYKDMECILVDDGCTDDSMNKVRRILANYQGPIQFVVLEHTQNKGQSVARNTGMRRATGDYLYFLDSDDRITSDCIALLASCLDGGREVDAVQGFWIENGIAHSCEDLADGEVLYVYDKEDIRRKYYLDVYPYHAWNKLLRRSFIIKNNLFFKPGIYHEDTLWLYYFVKCVSSLAICNSKTYIYDYSIGSTTTGNEKGKIKKRFISACYIINDIQNDMIKENIFHEYRIFIYYFCLYCNGFFLGKKKYSLCFRFALFIIKMMQRKEVMKGIYDILFYINLLPPFCFLLGWRPYLWRFREKVLGHIMMSCRKMN